MKKNKSVKKRPGGPAPAGTEVYKIYRNGELADKITISAARPQMIFYAESSASAEENYKGLTPEETKAAYLERAIRYLINSALYYLGDLSCIDLEAAKEVFSDMLDVMTPDEEGSKTKYSIHSI